MTTDCVTLWVGESLGPVERACFRSVLRHGHALALYCYGSVEAVPEGVEVRDAAEILPERDIVRHSGGSVAPFADWFRLQLQKKGLGTWVDTDLYLLRPLDSDRPYLFGEEEPGLINNAVLRIPANSPLLPLLLEIFETKRVPKWLPWRFYLPARLSELVRGKANLGHLPFGVTGPFALTAAAKRLGFMREAMPVEVFNPVRWQEADWIRSPKISLESVTTDRTVAVHLWNECIKSFKSEPAAPGSFLHRLQQEGG